MKTYGTYALENGTWLLSAEPHVMLRLKATFPRILKFQYGTVKMKHTPEACRDIEWFLDRFPLAPCSPGDALALQNGSKAYQLTLSGLEETRRPDYQPRTFALADGHALRPYQSIGVEVFLKRRALLLADAVGLGKTVTAIGALTCPETLPALVVCQTHLCAQWKEFLAQFLPAARVHVVKQNKSYALPDYDVLICSYHKLAAWADELAGQITSCIFDEVQELRHEGSAKYAAAQAIRTGATYAQGLSATPIYNYGGEIYNILEMIAPGTLGTREEFVREWCHYKGQHAVLTDPDSFGTYLRDEFLMLRRNRADVGKELPPVQTVVQSIPHSEDALKSIEGDATELARRILEGSFLEKGEAAREFDMRLRQATGIAKAPAVAAFVKMLIESGERVLLGAWHRCVWDIYLDHLSEFNPVLYTGSESPKQKEAAKSAILSGESKVMLMSLRSGVGVDGLQEALSTVVFGELDWSPGVMEQFTGRLQRDGQAGNVTAFYLVSDAGSDPTVSGVLGLKKAQVTGMLEPGTSGLQRTTEGAESRVKILAQNYLKGK